MAVPSNIYQDVINWALAQQGHEAANGSPVTLPPAQRRALLDLHQLTRPASAIPTEPEIGDTNWVGLLFRYRQANPLTPGSADPHDMAFIDEPVEHSPAPRWACYVSIAESDGPFPGPAGGLDPATGATPSFARKMNAKQYAARCAAEWLMAQNLMPSNGRDVKFPRPTAPARESPGAMEEEGGMSSDSSSPSVSASVSAPSPGGAGGEVGGAGGGATLNPKNTTPPVFFDDVDGDEPRSTQLVSDLCQTLGWSPPSYKLLQEGTSGYWSGYPISDDINYRRFPQNLGYVSNVLGKENAREKIADAVLGELRKMVTKRQATMPKFTPTEDGSYRRLSH
ncbi:hypothetical protein JX265_007569 [Neoarthrinium moseri]|uniref:DRBM domain-containing protein n=1 Tax=Neoarthrinium moseri TaxID=1658444 RepID=A0A9P9WJQ6_9PEZI|nr:uncharacterized protein JN550_000017 [Neoarthrinium moseri]KAI1854560.1 hypothetical protein JX266_000678 [Neoarthrinium moseri]KAI1866993.1 hypothetical protein JX265_007569 [Neoarthrinium moseri]KAI1877835.1 hypothetical protein JN550_000017 [Neoarthrinium moseri]